MWKARNKRIRNLWKIYEHAHERIYILQIDYQDCVLDLSLFGKNLETREGSLYAMLKFSTMLLSLSFSLLLDFMRNFSSPRRIYARSGRSL